jgi:hypothetical protein
MAHVSAGLAPELLRQLSLRALVALLARNARRVQPLFANGRLDDVDPQSLRAIEDAIRSAEAYAAGAPAAADDGTAAFAVAMRCRLELSPVAFVAALAACTADHAAGVGVRPEAEDEAQATAAQALVYFDAFLPEGTDPCPAQAEYEALLARGGPASPAAGEPIDSSEAGPLGPLWPAGKAPPWFRRGRTEG